MGEEGKSNIEYRVMSEFEDKYSISEILLQLANKKEACSYNATKEMDLANLVKNEIKKYALYAIEDEKELLRKISEIRESRDAKIK